MKKLFYQFVLLLFAGILAFNNSSNAQNVFIPDINFRAFLIATYPTFMDITGDSLIPDSAATLTGTLDCNSQNIAGLTGIECFINIAQLHCYGNQLTALPDLSANTALQRLYCNNNQLTALPDLSANTALQELSCNENQLTALPDLSANTALKYLYCNNNQLTALPDLLANIALKYLYCFNNQLTALPDLTANTALQWLYCYNNQLTALPVLSANTALTYLYCHFNQLTTLPDLLANTALLELICNSNKLDFSDARELRIADALSSLTAYTYSPQNPFGVSDTLNLCAGDTAVLSIALQDSALSYQWFKGTDTITGATDTLLIIPGITQADSGAYTCKSYGTSLLFPPMNFGPGISEFVSEPITIKVKPLPLVFIPDINFRAFLNTFYPTFMDSDSLIPDSAATLTGILDCNSQNIADLTGIGCFININTLYCYINQLTALPDLSANTALQYLYCFNNQLTALPDLSANTALLNLGCENNQLSSLPDLSANTALQWLVCLNNQLTSLPDLSPNTALQGFRCENNKLDFSDARELRIADTLSSLTTYTYSPQNPFGVSDTFNLCAGDTAVLSIALQDSALSYQWFKGTDTITGATDTLLIIPGINQVDSGAYTCKSYGTSLLFPPMNFGPGISEFVSEPIIVNVSPATISNDLFNVNSQIRLYPNPNKGEFNIIVNTAAQTDLIIELMNIHGQLIYRKDVKNVNTFKDAIDVSGLGKGIYYLRINTGEQVKVEKVVIQ